jgi:hypothetical protein
MAIRRLCAVLALVTLALGQSHQTSAPKGPANGYVPNATTAVKIAEAVLIPVFGEKQIASERPFHARLEGDVWAVDRTLYCSNRKVETTTNLCFGGAAAVKLSKSDARILFMTHYK